MMALVLTGAPEGSTEIENRIGQAIAERIVKAAKNKEDFRIYLVIPVAPAWLASPGRFEKNPAKEQESKN